MRAEIVAVGTEMLLFGRSDTNGDWLSTQLAERGVSLARRTVVGDGIDEIASSLAEARGRSDLVVVTGGLGPTADDVTREAVARALGRRLVSDPAIRERLRTMLAKRGYRDYGQAERQSQVPEGCTALDNPVGSAPGLFDPGPPCWTLVLPGVPGEMKAIFSAFLPRLAPHLSERPAVQERFFVAGLVESEVDAALRDLIGESPLATVTILASEGRIELHVLGRGAAGGVEVARIAGEIRKRLGPAIFSEGKEGPSSIAEAVGDLLLRERATLSVAESCTGGMLGAAITAVPGSSQWFVGGVLAYADGVKRDLLGVPASLIERHGAVSEPVARAMAQGARDRTGSSHALAITGIAGPEGGGADKPVGLVHLALSAGDSTIGRRYLLSGDRHVVRRRSVVLALDLLRRHLMGVET